MSAKTMPELHEKRTKAIFGVCWWCDNVGGAMQKNQNMFATPLYVWRTAGFSSCRDDCLASQHDSVHVGVSYMWGVSRTSRS